MSPGAATENKHHHCCIEVMFEMDHYSVGLCCVCGRYLFISGGEDKTVYQTASEREDELIQHIIYMKEQLARREASKT